MALTPFVEEIEVIVISARRKVEHCRRSRAA
jgi:hypothetical protein